jgi:hypothetical protein
MTEPTMPVTWNHRVLVFEEHGEKSYCVHEVHYDDDGSIPGWTANAIAVCSIEERDEMMFRVNIRRMVLPPGVAHCITALATLSKIPDF